MKVKTVSTLVTREAQTILPVQVPEYEQRVLQVVFGSDNVEVRAEAGEPVEVDPAGEVERLVRRWGQAALEKAYGAAFEHELPKLVAAAELKESAKKG